MKRNDGEGDKYTTNVNGDVRASRRPSRCRGECEEDYQNQSTE